MVDNVHGNLAQGMAALAPGSSLAEKQESKNLNSV
jgi:hypothetical protein